VSPYFTYDGRRYGKNRCVGRFFTLPSGTAFPRVEGAFVKIEEAGNVAFTVTVVNHPDNADRIGDKLKIRFSDVPQFFGA
jgi:hypothetical protein